MAGGNSNGDIPMLRFARRPGREALRLLVLHDDAEREFDYVAGAEEALQTRDSIKPTLQVLTESYNVGVGLLPGGMA